MTGEKLSVHFAPSIAARVGPDFKWWADAFRSWHFEGDPDKIFGRNAGNHPNGYAYTWARHMHVVPSPEVGGHERWERTEKAFYRTSDRLLVYSMDREQPEKYGALLLALLGDPGGHQRLSEGANAQELRQRWEDFAYAHQTEGDMPEGTVTDE